MALTEPIKYQAVANLVCAVDPGNEISAVVLYDPNGRWVKEHITAENNAIMSFLRLNGTENTELVIEQFESFGMAVGKSVFDTVWWSGRMFEIWRGPRFMLPRRAVKLHLCGTSRATDSNVRMAIYDAYGGKMKAVGNSKSPGPLYGMKGHEYSALAIALTHASQFGV